MTDRRLTLLLAASLLANVFAAGAVGGGLLMLSRQGGGRLHAAAPHRPIIDAGATLPAADRARFAHLVRRTLRDDRDLSRIARESREAAASLFVQPQFDQSAVNAALQRARDADIELRLRLETAAVGFAATLPVDERALLADALARGGPLRHPQHPATAPK